MVIVHCTMKTLSRTQGLKPDSYRAKKLSSVYCCLHARHLLGAIMPVFELEVVECTSLQPRVRGQKRLSAVNIGSASRIVSSTNFK